MEENGIDDDSKLSEAVKELIGILAYKTFFEEILLIDLKGSASQALETITDERLSLMELAILTPDEWESDYGIKLNKKMARRMAAFYHWLANPDPNYPTSNHRRLADMDRNKFKNYMMTEWRKPKAPPQSQDPQVAESAGFQPNVGIGNQPTMAASMHAATRQAGTQDAGGRRSVSDYTAFSNREGWSKWQHALLGTALDHKTEKVLDYTYIPDPNDTDACELFDSQKRFMYSVFTKTITEPSAVDILRNYSNPNSPDFGDAQQIYADLCDHFEGGAIGQVTITELETQLTTLHLNKSWTKSVSHFVHFVAGKIKDHKDLTNSNHDDHYYVKKLNATFEEHKDMSANIQTLKSQRSMLERNGITLQPISYESQLFELKQHATMLDHRYKKNQSSRNAHEASSRHDTSGGRNSGNRNTGNGGRGRGRGNGGRGSGGRGNFGLGPGGRGSGGRGNAGCGRSGGWLPRDEYFALSREERERRRNQYNNDNNSNNDSSGAPRAYNNSHSSVNNNNGGGSNINGSQLQQHSTNSSQQDHNNGSSYPSPGAMVRNMVSNASARSANSISTNEQEVMFNGRRYRLAVTYRDKI
eukprot:scaffold2387_cov106-Amphora_coffeaeformis.AAC.6